MNKPNTVFNKFYFLSSAAIISSFLTLISPANAEDLKSKEESNVSHISFFNVFSRNNIIYGSTPTGSLIGGLPSGSDFEGTVGAMGDVSLGNFSVAKERPQFNDFALLVGRSLSLEMTAVYGGAQSGSGYLCKGNVSVGKYNGKVIERQQDCSFTPSNTGSSISLEAAEQELLQLSNYYSGIIGPLVTPDSDGALRIEVYGTPSTEHYEVDANDLWAMGSRSLQITGPNTANLIINVRGRDNWGKFLKIIGAKNNGEEAVVDITPLRIAFDGGISAQNVTFNFVDAEKIRLQGGESFPASIMAPFAKFETAMTGTYGVCIQGNVWVGDLTGNRQINLPNSPCKHPPTGHVTPKPLPKPKDKPIPHPGGPGQNPTPPNQSPRR
jgi:choice-of-anchor A domain-containing protein